jgi:hypothetical protein
MAAGPSPLSLMPSFSQSGICLSCLLEAAESGAPIVIKGGVIMINDMTEHMFSLQREDNSRKLYALVDGAQYERFYDPRVLIYLPDVLTKE